MPSVACFDSTRNAYTELEDVLHPNGRGKYICRQSFGVPADRLSSTILDFRRIIAYGVCHPCIWLPINVQASVAASTGDCVSECWQMFA